MNVNTARSKLRQASEQSDFDSAKDRARSAKFWLLQAANASMDCGCTNAYSEFNMAASKAGRARDASSPDMFVSNLDKAIESFNAALQSLRVCNSGSGKLKRGK